MKQYHRQELGSHLDETDEELLAMELWVAARDVGAVQKGVSTYEQHRESVLMDVDVSTDCEDSVHEVNSDNFDRSEPIVIENREGREINTDKELPEHDAPDRGHSVGGTVTAQTPQKAEQEDQKGLTDTSDYDREFPKLETREQTLMRLQGDRKRHDRHSRRKATEHVSTGKVKKPTSRPSADQWMRDKQVKSDSAQQGVGKGPVRIASGPAFDTALPLGCELQCMWMMCSCEAAGIRQGFSGTRWKISSH